MGPTEIHQTATQASDYGLDLAEGDFRSSLTKSAKKHLELYEENFPGKNIYDPCLCSVQVGRTTV